MARARVNDVIELSSTQGAIGGALVTVHNLDNTPALAYADAVTATPLTQPIATHADGSIDFWVEEGSYLLIVAPSSISVQFQPQTVKVDATVASSTVSSHTQYVVGVHYTGSPPPRPDVGGAFVIWNGPVDPGNKAIDGDLGIGWNP
jgi:hypothetical protein